MSKGLGCFINILLMTVAALMVDSFSKETLFFIAIVICALNILFSLRDIPGQIVFIAFNILFFLFLLSRDLVTLIVDRKMLLSFPGEINNRVILCIILSLTFLSIGSYLTSRFRFTIGNYGYNERLDYTEEYSTSSYLERLKKVSRIVMYICAIPVFMLYIEQYIYVSTVSYYDLYLTYASRFPSVLVKIGDMYPIAFFAFLACLPNKKECKIPLILYASFGLISLGTGQRNQMMVHFIVIIIYLYFRQKIDLNEEIWMPKKVVVAICGSIPFVILFLFFWGNYRIGISIVSMSFGEVLKEFFMGQGKSIDIIGYAMYENVPSGKFYSFGDVIDFFINSFVSKNILGVTTYRQYTAEYALQMHSFGQYITYAVAPSKYFAGGGIGSCFIAEAFADFGYVGVAVWSTFYGVVLTKLSAIRRYSWVKLSLLLFAISRILMAPRSSTSAFIAATFSSINLATLLLIYILAKSKKHNR